MRVVSLLPSATEILAEIGATDLLVGRSHECDRPPSVAALPALTGQRTAATDSAEIDRQVREQLSTGQSLYTLDEAALRDLRPDLILTQDLCEVCSIDLRTVERIAASMHPRPAVLSLNPRSLGDVFDDVLRVGAAVGRPEAADEAFVRLRQQLHEAKDHVNAYLTGPEVAFLEWLDPIFVGGHWTPELIEMAGGRHSLNPPGAKSRVVTSDELVGSRPDRLVVCPCGMGLNWSRREFERLAAQPWWKELPAVRDGGVALVDGSRMFNRPGPRLVDAFRWLVAWLHDVPAVMPEGFPWMPADATDCST